MLSGKQRSHLKALANSMDPIMQIGKNGITDNVLKQIDDALEARELIKIKVLDNSFMGAKRAAEEITAKVGAEYVQSIGNKFIIYRQSKNKLIEIPM